MEFFLLYILKSGICLVIFYICVRAFLSNETFFRFNRFVILTGTAICLLIPLVKVSVQEPTPIQKPFIVMEETLRAESGNSTGSNIDDITGPLSITPVSETSKSPFHIAAALLIIYAAGITINLIILARSLYLMLRLINRGNKLKQGEYILVLVPEDITPFSWSKYIVLSVTDNKSDPDAIITHEIAHITHRHSLDLIYMELVLLFQWFNPAIWLLKREMKDIHEYQADISVLKSGIDATKYQLLLVKKAVGASSYTLANSFNHSKIKKRITMMLKIKSNKWARLKLLLLLPLGTLSIYAFARIEVNESPDPIVYDKGINNLGNKQNGNDYHFIIGRKEGFCFPLPSMIEVTGKYGKRGNGLHAGYDLTGRNGDEIAAAFDGDVVASEYDKVYGNYIRIQHADGLSTLYAHNSKNLVELNTSVKAGTVIAIIGNTGRSTGVHLHFEIHKNGEPIDPATIIDFDKKALRSSGPILQDKQKPDNYNPAYYTADGKKLSNAEYKDLMANSTYLFDSHYIPFAKGKVVKLQGVFNTGLLSPIYLREMFVDGKIPDRSHVYYVEDGVKYEYDGTKNPPIGEAFTNRVDAEKKAKSRRSGKVAECQFVAKDGSKSSDVWYGVRVEFTPPPPPPILKKGATNTRKKTPPPPPPIL